MPSPEKVSQRIPGKGDETSNFLPTVVQIDTLLLVILHYVDVYSIILELRC